MMLIRDEERSESIDNCYLVYRLFGMPTNKPVKLKSKHRMIADAFNRRTRTKRGSVASRMSLDFHTSHDDPLGKRITKT